MLWVVPIVVLILWISWRKFAWKLVEIKNEDSVDSSIREIANAERNVNESDSQVVGEEVPTPEKAAAVEYEIVYGTQTNTSKKLSHDLADSLRVALSNTDHTVVVKNCRQIDVDSLVTSAEALVVKKRQLIFILSTYTDGQPTADAEWFYKWLQDARFDFRMSKNSLRCVNYAVFGVGCREYGLNFCVSAKNVDAWMAGLGAVRMLSLGVGDVQDDMDSSFPQWKNRVIDMLVENVGPLETSMPALEEDEVEESASEGEASEVSDIEEGNSGDEMLDVEDMGGMAKKLRQAVQDREAESQVGVVGIARRQIGDAKVREPKAMVTPMLEKSLTKQGYKIVGTHSGVKVCRWTKSMLRGRGGCYKHSFYNIASHQCMETTPSLACANKCVFCWRHHTNPVGTNWRWKVDPPREILDGAMDNHYKMIKQLKGVPGVKSDRFQEAFDIQHCALSLVGEPIMYPHINEFVTLLHERHISSFLVTNAQFPEKILEMVPVTQLYVSIDAPTKESLKEIDRPLFSDYWERFLACLDALATKGQRTVYRLTLVKDYNTAHLEKYAELIRRGRPDFIEVKGVTFCGYSGASPLTMSNVPYQHEVISFVEKLLEFLNADRSDGDKYEIACEHAHSCSILVANKKFFVDNVWHTWIDYPKFHELVGSGKPFDSMDYIAPTPSWAIYGAKELGFDPEEMRVYRNKSGTTSGNE